MNLETELSINVFAGFPALCKELHKDLWQLNQLMILSIIKLEGTMFKTKFPG